MHGAAGLDQGVAAKAAARSVYAQAFMLSG